MTQEQTAPEDGAPPDVRLTLPQAAERAGVSQKTIRRMIARGQLVAQRVGQAYAIEPHELDAALLRVPPAGERRSNLAERAAVDTSELLDRLERQAVELGYLRAQLEERDRRIAVLEAAQRPALLPAGNRRRDGLVAALLRALAGR